MISGNIQKVHFIGIGGIGISALARMMLAEGKKVSGSDRSHSRVTNELEKLGAIIYKGHDAKNIEEGTDVVVYTIAVPEDNPEMRRARALGIPLKSYPEMLGEMSRNKKTIAVSGTHGKTTTTAMIADVLLEAGSDPTVIVGSLLSKERGNFIGGESDLFLVEACEYRRSFLHIDPFVLVITNIESDHLDYYRDIEDIKSAFRELALKTRGTIVCDPSDPVVAEVVRGAQAMLVDYTKEDIPSLSVSGEHNRKNARAARAVARSLKLPLDLCDRALTAFQGTWRRIERLGETANGAVVIDDYAHHPTEIRSSIEGLREMFPGKAITVLFQPHLASRTKEFLQGFIETLSLADHVLVAPIYKARAEQEEAISHEDIVRGIGSKARTFQMDEDLAEEVAGLTKDDVFVFMGAGDIYLLAEGIIAK